MSCPPNRTAIQGSCYGVLTQRLFGRGAIRTTLALHGPFAACRLRRYLLKHVAFQGSWTTHGALWIAMEYCGGGSVADLVHAADGPLDQDIIAYLCAETLAGLTYLHSIGKVPPLTHAHSPWGLQLQEGGAHIACEVLRAE